MLERGRDVAVGDNAKSIIRRYEFFKYTGDYDPEDHEALLLFPENNFPDVSELGIYLGVQNAGVNLNALAPVSVPRRLAAGTGRVCATQSHPSRLRSANSRAIVVDGEFKAAGVTRATAHTGAVTLIQRCGSALNLNIH